jgi:DUF2892 family protein
MSQSDLAVAARGRSVVREHGRKPGLTMKPLLRFFSSKAGRWTRSVSGLALVALGAELGGPWWLLLAPGAVLILVGVLDVCLLAPLFGKPLRGREFRQAQG